MTDRMTVQFWGTRGSIPTPGHATEKYGGNTTCLEVRYRDTVIILDAGSGLRELNRHWRRLANDGPVSASLLLTHLHWDHIQGFPFLSLAYEEQNEFTIYGQDRDDQTIRELLGGQMQPYYFPVSLAEMQASLNFEPALPSFTVGDIQVRSTALPHPGGCLAYRLEAGDAVLILATDCELDRAAINGDEIKANPLAARQYEPAFLDFFADAHVLVLDCQYTDEDYSIRQGWGHNPVATVVDFARHCRPAILATFHHDPESDDAKVVAIANSVARQLAKVHNLDIVVFPAREGLTLDVASPKRPIDVLEQQKKSR